ncbi:MAG: UDP-glucose:(heptosyl)LPS alpha-1,3-glucosyltransferase [Planctomycetota bacterium]|jgi:UDP-glucose:(heptosyl)LPS alpha-1,3-glucosyltransferase
MRVAFVLFRYFAFGGMQRDMLATAELCAARGHDVTVFCYGWEGGRPRGVKVAVLQILGRANHVRAARFDRALRERLAAGRPDVVIGFDKMSGLDMYFAADPCFVARTASRPWPYRLLPRYRAFRRLEEAVFGPESQTQILLLDPAERSKFQSVWHTAGERFVALPPGIARDRCKGADAAALRRAGRQEFDVGDNDQLVLLLGANFLLKGLDRAMHAVADLPDELRARTRLLAVGQDAPKWASTLAAKLGIDGQVTMTPGRQDIPRLLQAADLLLHPAHRDTTGTVLLEAVVAGLPVLCSADCGYAHHITASQCGYVEANWGRDSGAQQRFVELLQQDTTQMRTAALRYAGQHDLHAMHEEICDRLEAAAR